MVASALSRVTSTMALPETAPSSNRSTTEPMYLAKLWDMVLDSSRSEEERKALEAQYFAQCTRWKTIQSRLVTAIASLGGSDFWDSLCRALQKHSLCGKVEDVVCLCLGNLEDNATMYQLSVLILLLQKLDIPHEKCFVFDPCHSSHDKDILKFLGFTILQENAEAKICVRKLTLFYMPHGDHHLTNNLIAANYNSLHDIAILGNNLAWVCDSKAQDLDNAAQINSSVSRAPDVLKVLALVEETHLEDALASSARSQLANLAPRVSEAFGNSLCDFLDCTLSTFRPKSPF